MATRTKAESGEGEAQRASATGGARSRRGASGGGEVFEALLAGLEEVLPGIEVLDRDLVFEDGGRADLAAVDPSGRLILVLVAAQEGERAVIEALDVLAFARGHAAILARHLGGRRINPMLGPRTIVINGSNDRTLAERLAPLSGQGVEVFGVKTLQSAAGERSYLVPVGPVGATAAPGERGVEAFVAALPTSLRDLGRRLVERMGRLDEDLDATADRNSLVWRFNGEVLARLERAGNRLLAGVGSQPDAAPVASREDVERLVEEALGRLVELIGVPETPQTPLPTHIGDRGGALEEGPLLTPEEIEAFRE